MVYITANATDADRAHTLGLGFILDQSASTPHALLSGAGQTAILNEPFTAQQLASALQPILDAEAATAAAQATLNANQDVLDAKAQTALATNISALALPDPTPGNTTYIGIASPSNAQVAAQVKALTQQNNALYAQVTALTKQNTALIRLALGLLDSTAGT